MGGDPGRKYHLGLAVWAMGDQNSVCVSQAVHEDVLKKHGGLRPHQTLAYRSPMPLGSIMQGVYVDDLLIVAVVNKEDLCVPSAAEDTDLLERALEAYGDAHLPVAPQKDVTREGRFTAWGTSVDSFAGTCGAPVDRRIQLVHLCFEFPAGKVCSKDTLSSVIGSLVHPFMHRKPSGHPGTSLPVCYPGPREANVPVA